jgi:hypothetical protein
MPLNPTDLIGSKCSFEHKGKRLTGIITDAKDNGFAEPGHLADLLITVRGSSGLSLTVSMIDSYMSFPDR